MKKIIFIIILIAISVGIFFFFIKEKPQNFSTIAAHYGDLKIKVEAMGDLYANEIVNVGAQASGEILELNVKVGDKLKKGDIIAQLDREKQENNLNIELAKQNSLNALKKSKELSLQISKREYQNQEKLYKKGATSYDNVLKAKNEYYSISSDLAQIKSQIEQNKVSVENYKKELDYTTITAPIDGYVIALVASKGQTINSSQNSPTIVKLADTNTMEARMFISQNDINKLKKGMKVEFKTLADDKKQYTAILENIDIADTITVDGVNKGAVYYYARFYTQNKNNELKVGMSIIGDIQIEYIKNTLLLPTIYIQHDDNGYYVNVLKGQDKIRQAITIGLSDSFNTQILSGLSVDDKIIIFKEPSLTKMPRKRR